MSTRANVVIIDRFESPLFFYKHSDGYESGVLPKLEEFLDLVKTGKIRNNASQAAGWLIMLGAEEYETTLETMRNPNTEDYCGPSWKVGAYEPTTGLHGDIEYLYVVNLQTRRIVFSQNCTTAGLDDLIKKSKLEVAK